MDATLNDTMLFLTVTAKKAASAAASRQLSEVLDRWAKNAVDGCAVGEVPKAEIDAHDVELLLSAMAGPQTIDRLVEVVDSKLKYAWRSLHRLHGYGIEIPWNVVSYDVSFEHQGSRISVRASAKALAT